MIDDLIGCTILQQHLNGLESNLGPNYCISPVFNNTLRKVRLRDDVRGDQQRGAAHSRRKECRVSITYIFSIPARPFAWHNLADVELLRAIVSLTRQSSLWCPHGELLQLPLISSAVSSANGPLASCIFSLFDLFLAASNILLAIVPVAQRAHYRVASAPLRRGEGYGGEVSS